MTLVPPPIVVLLGGPSAEHDVSIVSGNAIAAALAAAGHRVERMLIGLDGAWWNLGAVEAPAAAPPEPATPATPAPAAYDEPSALGADGPWSAAAAIDRLGARRPQPIIFIALHGPFGEDGTVQALLEAGGLAYTGSGVTASAIGMDKAIFKRLCRGIGLPVVDWLEVPATRWSADRAAVLDELESLAAGTGDPRLMVKPARLGSSIGMSIAHRADERAAAIETALAFDTMAIVERFVAGARDLEVSVIGNDPDRLESYGPGEITSGREFYDFAAKYTPGLSTTIVAADVAERTGATLRALAVDCYRAIGAAGFARIDFLLAGEDVFLSEINTIPGFTPISLFPRMPVAGGYTFTSVAERIVSLAAERRAAAVGRQLTPADLPR